MNIHIRHLFLALIGLAVICPLTRLAAKEPEWIWFDHAGAPHSGWETTFFRKTFTVVGAFTKAELTGTVDLQMTAYLNGRAAATNKHWDKPVKVDVTAVTKPGENIIAARGRSDGVDPGFILRLELTLPDKSKRAILSDTTWLCSTNEAPGWEKLEFAAAGWTKPVSKGELGVQPWGALAFGALATPTDSLQLLPGFKAELLRSAQPDEGSWVCLTIDDKGRLIISPQERNSDKDGGMLRVTLDNYGQLDKIEPLDTPVGAAMGLLYVFDGLYVSGQGPNGNGLYRLRDTRGNDQFDSVQLLKKFEGGADEHGAHAIALGPDKLLYLINGNNTRPPEGFSPDSPHRNYQEDYLLPRILDPVATFFDQLKVPYGYVVRTDAEGKNWELVCGGLRNAYDFDFNRDGEMITYDSDMEWDIGLPWYRPTRISHLVSGGEYGFREGSTKWPIWYSDSLPETLNIGLGSPTGIKFGTHSQFPPRYQEAMFAMDWAYGRILAVHLKPQGASYTAASELFLSGKAMPVTDLEFGKDGAMYFITGGRGTQSGLYRVTYVGPRVAELIADVKLLRAEAEGRKARALRRKLESFHGRPDPTAIDFLWPHLNSKDRWIRYAARIALERQEVNLWMIRALGETNTEASLTALLALVRVGDGALQNDILDRLGRLSPDQLTESQKLESLRVLALSLIRQGMPEPAVVGNIVKALDSHFPAATDSLNRELCSLLAYLDAPQVVGKTMALLTAAASQEQQIHYVCALRSVKPGWTRAQREAYFNWFKRAQEQFKGGNSFAKFLTKIEQEAVAALPDAERTALAAVLENRPAANPAAAEVKRAFVREWRMEDLLPVLDQIGQGRSLAKGRAALLAAQCLTCHRFANEGGSVGPDITAVASRFNRHDLLESILLPSKVIPDQYRNFNIIKRDGTEITGLIVEETAAKVVVMTNALTREQIEIPKAEITKREPSLLSPMPEGLLNTFTQDEILDLLAYVESGATLPPDKPAN